LKVHVENNHEDRDKTLDESGKEAEASLQVRITITIIFNGFSLLLNIRVLDIFLQKNKYVFKKVIYQKKFDWFEGLQLLLDTVVGN